MGTHGKARAIIALCVCVECFLGKKLFEAQRGVEGTACHVTQKVACFCLNVGMCEDDAAQLTVPLSACGPR